MLKSSAEGVSLRSWQSFWSNRKSGSNILVLISLVPYRAFGLMASCTQGVIRYGRRWIFFPSPCNLGLAEPCGDIVSSVRDCVKKIKSGGGRWEIRNRCGDRWPLYFAWTQRWNRWTPLASPDFVRKLFTSAKSGGRPLRSNLAARASF